MKKQLLSILIIILFISIFNYNMINSKTFYKYNNHNEKIKEYEIKNKTMHKSIIKLIRKHNIIIGFYYATKGKDDEDSSEKKNLNLKLTDLNAREIISEIIDKSGSDFKLEINDGVLNILPKDRDIPLLRKNIKNLNIKNKNIHQAWTIVFKEKAKFSKKKYKNIAYIERESSHKNKGISKTKINLKYKNVTILKVLNEISKQTGFSWVIAGQDDLLSISYYKESYRGD